MNSRSKAFTLIEVLVVTAIVGILTVGMARSLASNRDRAEFQELQLEIVGLIQQGRSLSLSNQLVVPEGGGDAVPIDYYLLVLNTDEASLRAVNLIDGAPNDVEYLAEFTYNPKFYVTHNGDNDRVYFNSPDGEICYTNDCGDSYTEKTYTIQAYDPEFPYQTNITIDVFGGFPEIEEITL